MERIHEVFCDLLNPSASILLRIVAFVTKISPSLDRDRRIWVFCYNCNDLA